jgi:hypothetical protein
MLRAYPMILALLAPMMFVTALAVRAQSANDPYSIMAPEVGAPPDMPEPWLAPKYRSPRGTRLHVTPLHHGPPTRSPRAVKVPPPIVVPETGRALPNLPTLSPSGPHGTETFQDRAARCMHQAGVYGNAIGNRNAYIGTCVNQ